MLTNFQNSFTDRLAGKFATNSYLKSHHTLNMSLHYLVKCEFQKTGINLKYVLWLMINYKVPQPSILVMNDGLLQYELIIQFVG